MGFKERLKEARKAKGYTQEMLANAIGIAKSTVTGYEKGNSEPDMGKIFKIMSILEVDANYLWQDEMNELSNKTILSQEAIEVAKVYDKAEIDKQNIVRLTLGLDLKKDTKITRIHEPRPDKYDMVAETPAEYPDHLKLNAARPLKGATGEYKQHDEDIY